MAKNLEQLPKNKTHHKKVLLVGRGVRIIVEAGTGELCPLFPMVLVYQDIRRGKYPLTAEQSHRLGLVVLGWLESECDAEPFHGFIVEGIENKGRKRTWPSCNQSNRVG